MSQTYINSAQISYWLNILQNITSLFIYRKVYADSICLKCPYELVFLQNVWKQNLCQEFGVKTPDLILFKLVSEYFISPAE